ncbi:MAG: chemotaxis protein CheW [Actinomycetes bacterium]
MSGYVMFMMGGREMAGRLTEVREVVRAIGVEPLTGARAPVTGLLTLRGHPLPVVDLRSGVEPGDVGDVLVLVADDDGALGLAVDNVLAVLGPDELAPLDADYPASRALPSYVLEVRRNAAGSPVFVVALRALAGLVHA